MYIPPGFIALLLSKLLVPMDTIGVMYSWLNYDIIGGCKEGGEQNRPRTDRILYKKKKFFPLNSSDFIIYEPKNVEFI